MSSILRALKKLETEPGHTAEKQPLETKFVPLAEVSPPKKGVATIKVAVAGGIVCGLVVLAGWQLFSSKNEVPPVAKQSAQQVIPPAELKIQAPESSGSPMASPPAAEPEKLAAEPAPPVKKEVTGHTVETLPQQPPAAAEPQPPEIVEEQTLGPHTETPEIRSPEIAVAAPAERPAPAPPVPAEKPVKVKEPEIPVLNDPDMKLQAITWSKNPQKRIAVINSRILRQGDTVNGYRIATINQDDIILNDGGEQWKLLFRIR